MTLPAKSSSPASLKALPTYTGIFEDLGDRYMLKPRESQLELAKDVRDALLANGVLVEEAPTGTGKTLGYLAGALDAQAHAPFPVPIVVATATVGLQEQILRQDIPRLASVGALDPRRVAVAKGRGRYFCPRTTALLEEKKAADGQFDMFNSDKHVAEGGTQVALDMLKSWRKGEWDGDRDNWPGVIPGCWEASCGASSDTCVNRACEYFEKCPYMLSRAKLSQADLIVANHDMVLADLAQRAEEQTSTALPPKKYWLIVDEAHNLPEKAVATKQATANLTETDWLRSINEYGDRCLSTPPIERALNRQGVAQNVFSRNPAVLVSELERLAKEFSSKLTFDLSGVSSWGLGDPPKELKEEVFQIAGYASMLLDAFKATAKAFSDFADESVGADKAFAIRMLSQTHKYARQTKDLCDGLERFCTGEQVVRWVFRSKEDRVTLETKPMEGDQVLKELLWKQEFPVALVSATLQIAGSFGRFKDKTGLPSHAVTKALPPVFDYTRGYLHQPFMETDPNGAGFEAELALKIPKLFNNDVSQGLLVLFTSRQRMRRVVRMMPETIAARMLVQDHRPIPELVAQHKERIDRGERSILVGLDSMSEGLDLPGRYCGHVVITQLPFGVPGDPVEEARRLHLGRAWFEQAYLADMLTMLIQGTGRLIRREEDHGVITVLDKRLHTKRYAAKAMSALPAFTRGSNLQGYFDMRAERSLETAPAPKPSAAKLTLVHSKMPAEPAPTSVAAEAKVKAARVAEDEPLAPLWRLKAVPAATGKPMSCSTETLPGALNRALPFSTEAVSDEEVPTQGLTEAKPFLPVGTPAATYGERQMPQAVLLGLRLMNMPWDSKKPAWYQVLSLRPDLLQFAEVLRAHVYEWEDYRKRLVPRDVCFQQIEQGLAGLGLENEQELFEGLTKLEAEAVYVLCGPHTCPSRDFMVELPAAAWRLATHLRKGRV